MIKTIRPAARLRGTIMVPGDKSISHRAFLFNAMAQGTAHVANYGRGADVYSTIGCLRALGVDIQDLGDGRSTVRGRGMAGFRQPSTRLDAGNSGTTMRLMSGLLVALPFQTVITGDVSLRRRPMDRVIQPLRLMDAVITGSGDNGTLAPLTIRGGGLKGAFYKMPFASAQVKSAILIAGVNAEGDTVVDEMAPTRDHTERMFGAMGATVTTEGTRVSIHSARLKTIDVTVPGDMSSAAFWLAAACIHPDADILVEGVGVNPSRTGMLDALHAMGADIRLEKECTIGGEPVADLRARSSCLRGILLSGDMIPRLIDELPILSLVAAVASGKTEIRDAEELRVKESDRIAGTGSILRALGARVEEMPDGLIIQGGASLKGAESKSFGDHRLAMVLAVAGLVAKGRTAITDAESADISYPEFWRDLDRISATPA